MKDEEFARYVDAAFCEAHRILRPKPGELPAQIRPSDAEPLVDAYAKLLCDEKAPMVRDESLLPIPKKGLRFVLLARMISHCRHPVEMDALIGRYQRLACFQPYVGRKGVDITHPNFEFWINKMFDEMKVLTQEAEQYQAFLKAASSNL